MEHPPTRSSAASTSCGAEPGARHDDARAMAASRWARSRIANMSAQKETAALRGSNCLSSAESKSMRQNSAGSDRKMSVSSSDNRRMGHKAWRTRSSTCGFNGRYDDARVLATASKSMAEERRRGGKASRMPGGQDACHAKNSSAALTSGPWQARWKPSAKWRWAAGTVSDMSAVPLKRRAHSIATHFLGFHRRSNRDSGSKRAPYRVSVSPNQAWNALSDRRQSGTTPNEHAW
mmetsp:Transcript_5288/g.17024  ORF Transcript_5288/g.17024 Transcript_5288/m.17024 type:complete len:234 (+) Transcript_5288:2889-3590(+)